MLKSKKGIYILLPIVAIVWGAIIFQVVDAFSDNENVVVNTTNIQFKTIKTKERSKFNISQVIRDPFLGTLYLPKKEPIKKNKRSVKKDTIKWPTIRYKGLVSAQDASVSVFLIEINGADQILKIKETYNEVKLLKGNSSSIKLRFKGKTKQFEILN